MDILLGVLAVPLGIAVWMWAIKPRGSRRAVPAARQRATAGESEPANNNFFGRHSGDNLGADSGPQDGTDNVRIAVAGVMAVFAAMDRTASDAAAKQQGCSSAQQEVIKAQCRSMFQVDRAEAEKLVAYGCGLARQSDSTDEALRGLAKGLRHNLDTGEKRQLTTMARRVATAQGGRPTKEQEDALVSLAHLLD